MYKNHKQINSYSNALYSWIEINTLWLIRSRHADAASISIRAVINIAPSACINNSRDDLFIAHNDGAGLWNVKSKRPRSPLK